MTSINQSIQEKTVVLDKITKLLEQIKLEQNKIALEIEQEKLNQTFKIKKQESRKENFDVVSISRPIYWPDRGYYENISKDKYFETCYNKII
ncbi:hypothetical protein CPAV1605_1114 [seawater metagenome]|uniref:Uncharacterized protein n=1 Tax=seawater metagenome TaxID=1561972 RepID=A0A5E8CJ02_9ZZZZ